jgi:hypothetical protein
MRIEYNYRENENLRRSFNELAEKVLTVVFCAFKNKVI